MRVRTTMLSLLRFMNFLTFSNYKISITLPYFPICRASLRLALANLIVFYYSPIIYVKFLLYRLALYHI